MDKCRVLELIGGSLSDGGAETLVKDYVLNLDSKKVEPVVFADWTIPGAANTDILQERGASISTVYPSYSLFWRGINRFFRKSCFVRKLRQAISGFNPDVIHVHLDALEYLVPLEEMLKGRKLFYTCHSEPSAMFDDNPAEEEAAKKLIKDCGLRLIALHEEMAGELNRRFGVSDTLAIKNGIDLTRFTDVTESKKQIRLNLGIPEKAFVIGNVGRFSEEKNHRMIVSVFSEVRKQRTDAFLLLVGGGELKDAVRDMLTDAGLSSCSMILSNRKDVPQLLKAMDVFLFPSLYEGLGLSLIEAQAAGLVCVASDKVPLDARPTGLVTTLKLDDPIETWCAALLKTHGGSGCHDALRDYDIRGSVRELEELYLGKS